MLFVPPTKPSWFIPYIQHSITCCYKGLTLDEKPPKHPSNLFSSLSIHRLPGVLSTSNSISPAMHNDLLAEPMKIWIGLGLSRECKWLFFWPLGSESKRKYFYEVVESKDAALVEKAEEFWVDIVLVGGHFLMIMIIDFLRFKFNLRRSIKIAPGKRLSIWYGFWLSTIYSIFLLISRIQSIISN